MDHRHTYSYYRTVGRSENPGGGSSNVVSIICPLPGWDRVNLSVKNWGFHGVPESDRPFLLLRRYTVLCAMVYLHFKYCQLAFLPTKTVDYQSYTYTRIPNKCTSSDFGQFLHKLTHKSELLAFSNQFFLLFPISLLTFSFFCWQINPMFLQGCKKSDILCSQHHQFLHQLSFPFLFHFLRQWCFNVAKPFLCVTGIVFTRRPFFLFNYFSGSSLKFISVWGQDG